ncbi:P-loop containing nucleoside triphosphate hydrolase protein [Mycena rosella]|uniref:P-loop containing nucleoside triphosphate hydrolase protein n=1 Tax=Mycena rosella TaxID=1033263 RepID=A0AAD7M6Q8_MYCRO|nr:P-loop containing nucleoside triphosphate hydrolase protein [Mycena rosella]
MTSCAQDASFGPVSSCRSFDFTVDFEQTILSFSPDVVFSLLALSRLVYLESQPRQSPTAKINTLKCAASLFVIGCTTASLVYGRQHHLPSAIIWLAAPIFQILCAVLLSLLVMVEQLYTIAPSTLIIAYAFIRGVFTAASLRSAVQIGLSHGAIAISALVTSSYLLLFCVELIPKPTAKVISDVSTSNIISRSLYIWLFPLLWAGRNKVLRIEDCGSIPHEFGACATRERLDGSIHESLDGKPIHFIRDSLRAFPSTFLGPVFPRILLLVATFSQPLLVSRMIGYISELDPPSDKGWALVGAFVCVYGLIALTTSIYWEKVFDGTVRYRAGLVGSIYSKSLRLSSKSGRDLGGGVASTYMSVDVERICQGLEVLHETWAALVSIILAVLLLYSQATWPAFLPLGITLILFAVAAYISRGIGAAQGLWLASTDKRVKYLTSVLHNYLPMKWARYEDVVGARAAQLRAEEMRGAHSFYNNICITGALTVTAGMACNLSVLGPYAALAAHGHGHGALDPNRLFTVVATLNLMTEPLGLIGGLLPQLMAAYASMKRIEDYLSRPEKIASSNETQWDAAETPGADAIRLEAASFSWVLDSSPFLGPLSLGLKQGELHVCVGPVAAGKSMFLLSLLGETTCTQGSMSVPDAPIAYAAQEPLIIAATVRDNILFGQEYSANWYNRVLDACALRSEIDRMEAQDGTFLNEKGTNLSGGQRQRIALARAVYAKAAWTLLDDTFSALDAQTADHVKHLGGADNILVVESGSVRYQGTLIQIKDAGYKIEANTSDDSTTTSGLQETSKDTKEYEDMEEQDETAIQRSSGGFTPYLFYMRAAGWGNSVAVVALLSLSGCIGLGSNVYLQQWAQKSGRNVGSWVGGYAGLTLGNFILIAFGMWTFAMVITNRVGQKIHAEEISGLLRAAPGYMMATSAGRAINRFSQDIFMCDLEFTVAVLNVILSSVAIVGSVVFILIPAPWLALAVPFVGAIYWIVLSFYLKTSKQFQQLTAASKSPLYTLFSTTLSGLVTIRAMRVEGHFQRLNDAHLDRSQIPFYFRFAGLRFLRTFLTVISFILATGLAALVVGLRKSMNPASLGLALASLTSISGQLSDLVMNLSGLENAAVSISRIHEVASLPEEKDPAAGSPEKRTLAATLREAPSLTFKDVHMRYRADLPEAIRNVSFHISAGQKIGICGRSGSGKSSLILAIFRGLDQALMAGEILINGLDTQTIPLETLRQSLSLVAQRPVIWFASVRENIDPHGIYTDQEIWSTLDRIGIAGAITDLPEKLDTVLEDEGSISTGQRQLLCLARVLLRKRKFVVLDEASSSLDLEMDKKIREIIRSELADCTVISIAHRIETIADFDMILVMEDGIVAETGSPAELLSRPDSKFARLAASQGIRAP